MIRAPANTLLKYEGLQLATSFCYQQIGDVPSTFCPGHLENTTRLFWHFVTSNSTPKGKAYQQVWSTSLVNKFSQQVWWVERLNHHVHRLNPMKITFLGTQKCIMKSYWNYYPKSTRGFLNTKFHRVHRRPWWPCSITPSCHDHISMRKSWWKQNETNAKAADVPSHYNSWLIGFAMDYPIFLGGIPILHPMFGA